MTERTQVARRPCSYLTSVPQVALGRTKLTLQLSYDRTYPRHKTSLSVFDVSPPSGTWSDQTQTTHVTITYHGNVPTSLDVFVQ